MGVINGVLGQVTINLSHIWGLIAPLLTTHEPPSPSPSATMFHTSRERTSYKANSFVSDIAVVTAAACLAFHEVWQLHSSDRIHSLMSCNFSY